MEVLFDVLWFNIDSIDVWLVNDVLEGCYIWLE